MWVQSDMRSSQMSIVVVFFIYLLFESLSNTQFPITRRVSLYLELISGKRWDRTSIIVMVALSANHYSTRAEIFDKFVMCFLRFVLHRGRYQFPFICCCIPLIMFEKIMFWGKLPYHSYTEISENNFCIFYCFIFSRWLFKVCMVDSFWLYHIHMVKQSQGSFGVRICISKLSHNTVNSRYLELSGDRKQSSRYREFEITSSYSAWIEKGPRVLFELG